MPVQLSRPLTGRFLPVIRIAHSVGADAMGARRCIDVTTTLLAVKRLPHGLRSRRRKMTRAVAEGRTAEDGGWRRAKPACDVKRKRGAGPKSRALAFPAKPRGELGLSYQ